MKRILIFFLTITLLSCSKNRADFGTAEPIEMQFAELLTMSQGDGFWEVEIRNPWDTTGILHRYILIEHDSEISESTLPHGDIVRIPLTNSVVCTSPHAFIIEEMGGFPSIKGVCDARYMNNEQVQKGIKTGTIADLGSSEMPDIEKVIELNPDAILLSPYQNSGSYGRLGKLGIPLIECADYMETSALGRAEWIKFYGLLYGCKSLADSIFSNVTKNYDALVKQSAENNEKKPTMFADMKTGSTWYVAGNQTTAARLYTDAGAEYIFNDIASTGSVPMNPESVFDRAQDADIWIIKYNQPNDLTYKQLAQDYPNYTRMKSFKEKNVYGCNGAHSRLFDETAFHPDWLLKEYIKIFHPVYLPDYNLRYFQRIEN